MVPPSSDEGERIALDIKDAEVERLVIVGASALLAVIFREPGYERLVTTLATAEPVGAGTPTLTEAGIVVQARLEASAHGVLERILDEFAIEEVRFGELHWREAVEAFRRFGRADIRRGSTSGTA